MAKTQLNHWIRRVEILLQFVCLFVCFGFLRFCLSESRIIIDGYSRDAGVRFFVLFFCCYKTRKSILRLPPLEANKTPRGMSIQPRFFPHFFLNLIFFTNFVSFFLIFLPFFSIFFS